MTKNELINQFENGFPADNITKDEKGEYLDYIVLCMWRGYLCCADINGLVPPGTSLEGC